MTNQQNDPAALDHVLYPYGKNGLELNHDFIEEATQNYLAKGGMIKILPPQQEILSMSVGLSDTDAYENYWESNLANL